MNTQHRPDEHPGNAASKTRVRVLAALFVVVACAGIATTVAAPDDTKEPDPAEQKKLDDSYVGRFQRAQRLMGRGSDEEAEKVFRELIAERPEEASVHHALGLLLQFRKRPDDATKELLVAAKLAPEEAVIQRDTGLHLLSLGRVADAEKYLAAAAKLWPEDVESAVGHGAALRALGRNAEAQVEYRRAIATDDNSVDAAVGLAACLVDTEPEAALKLVEKATGQWPDVLLVRGVANLRLERYDAAVESLSVIVKTAPPGPAGLIYVRGAAETLVLCGAAKPAGVAAQKWFDAESAAGAPSGAAAFCLAQTREALGDHKAALDALAAAKKEPSADRTLLEAAVLLHLQRKDDAKSALESLAASEKESFERSAAKYLLGRLDAAEFAKLAEAPGLANDVAWIESLAAEMAGDADAAATARAKAAEASKPRGEYPGLLVRSASAK